MITVTVISLLVVITVVGIAAYVVATRPASEKIARDLARATSEARKVQLTEDLGHEIYDSYIRPRKSTEWLRKT